MARKRGGTPSGPRVRLFLSVDLVGSTAYKQRTPGDPGKLGPAWAKAFLDFYSGFPKLFEQPHGGEKLPADLRPKLVKAIGDELLLQTTIRGKLDAHKVLKCLCDVLPAFVSKNYKPDGLSIKVTAWIAGFPFNNHVVTLPGGSIDFIGPSIDAGFRICRFSTPSRMMVSPDLALLLASNNGSLEMHFGGTESLKGVLDGKPYPLIWVRVKASDLEESERVLADRKPCDPGHLTRYCREYIKTCEGTWLIEPYFVGGNDSDFREMPAAHQQATAIQQDDDRKLSAVGPDGGNRGKPVAALGQERKKRGRPKRR